MHDFYCDGDQWAIPHRTAFGDNNLTLRTAFVKTKPNRYHQIKQIFDETNFIWVVRSFGETNLRRNGFSIKRIVDAGKRILDETGIENMSPVNLWDPDTSNIQL